MATLVSDDGVYAQVRTDGGTIERIPSEMARARGITMAPAPMPGPMPGPSPMDTGNAWSPFADPDASAMPGPMPGAMPSAAPAAMPGPMPAPLPAPPSLEAQGPSWELQQRVKAAKTPEQEAAARAPEAAAQPPGATGSAPTKLPGIDPNNVRMTSMRTEMSQSGSGLPGFGFGSGRLGKIERAGRAEIAAQGDLDKIAAQKAAEEHGAAMGRLQAIQDADAKYADIQSRKKVYFDEEMSKYAADRDALKSAKPDPDHLWKERGTGNKILAAIAVGLGAFGSAINGGPNAALDIVQSAIDRDIQAQKDAIANKREDLADRRTMLGMNMERFGDEEAAVLATRAHGIEAAMAQLDVKTAALAGTEAEKRGLVIRAGMEKTLQGVMADLEDRLSQRAMQRAELESKFGPGVDPKTVIPGVGVANSPEAAKEVQDATTARDQIVQNLALLKDLRKEYGMENRWSAVNGRAMQILQDVKGAYNQLKRFGALDKGTDAALERIFQNPLTFWFKGNADSAMDTAGDLVNRGYETTLAPRLRMRERFVNGQAAPAAPAAPAAAGGRQ